MGDYVQNFYQTHWIKPESLLFKYMLIDLKSTVGGIQGQNYKKIK